VHLERVAGREVGDVVAQARLVDQVGGVHRASLQRRRCTGGTKERIPAPVQKQS
jgi:hypothetical protein